MRILLLSPYHTGSHQAWAEGYATHSRHEVRSLSLPGQLWKWRMHGAAVTLAGLFEEELPAWAPEALLADDMLDLATFLALTRRRTATVPVILYMHENQLTYPLPKDGRRGPMRRNMGLRERQYVLINWKSMLAADEIWFNSAYHRDSFLAALPPFLRHYPDHSELATVDRIAIRSRVMPAGIDLMRLRVAGDATGRREARAFEAAGPPLILWNQRWEYDKNPEAFFQALEIIQGEGRPFRLALCGENFQIQPALFTWAQERFGAEIVHVGFAPEADYRRLLQAANIVISTARHEFFGISVLEAIFAGAFPILPWRLSYPELLPARFHARCLYQKRNSLLGHLRWALNQPAEAAAVARDLAEDLAAYDWGEIAPRYDREFSRLAREK